MVGSPGSEASGASSSPPPPPPLTGRRRGHQGFFWERNVPQKQSLFHPHQPERTRMILIQYHKPTNVIYGRTDHQPNPLHVCQGCNQIFEIGPGERVFKN